jgi:segregation and condensation protein B
LATDEPGALTKRMRASSDSAAPGESDEESVTSGELRVSEAAQSPAEPKPRAGRVGSRSDDPGWVDERLKSILESLLFAAGEPVSLAQLANAIEEVPRERIRQMLSEMAAAYASSGRGFVLEEIAGGYQLRTSSEHAVYVRRLLSAKPPRLSRAMIETLAIVAYRQPITHPEIEQLRGVGSGGVLDSLIDRNLIRIRGRKDAPGRPMLYATTPEFLELFGLKDLEGLPDLEEFRELEGSRDPAEAATNSRPADSAQDAPLPSDAEAPARTILNEALSDQLTVGADEILPEASASETTQSEDPGSPTNADEPAKAENKDEP